MNGRCLAIVLHPPGGELKILGEVMTHRTFHSLHGGMPGWVEAYCSEGPWDGKLFAE